MDPTTRKRLLEIIDEISCVLFDPPPTISDLIKAAQEGYDTVLNLRFSSHNYRKGDGANPDDYDQAGMTIFIKCQLADQYKSELLDLIGHYPELIIALREKANEETIAQLVNLELEQALQLLFIGDLLDFWDIKIHLITDSLNVSPDDRQMELFPKP